jgi:HSP20 family protein
MFTTARFVPAASLDHAFDDLFRGFLSRPVASPATERRTPFAMDVTEDDRSYVVHADLPGVKKEDIQISIDGNRVEINASVKREVEAKEGIRVLKVERVQGAVGRTFTLAQEVDSDAAQAKYADGVLELTLPKKIAPTARQITIQ